MGVHIDNKLSFLKHINYLSGKISRSTGIFYRIRRFLPLKARIQFYYCFIYPYLSYCVIVWGATFPTHLTNIIVQQKRIIRLIGDRSYLEHTTPLFYSYRLLKFEDIFRYSVSLYMFHNRFDSQYRTQHQIFTRSRDLAIPSFNRLTLSQHSITYIGPKIWNDLPLNIRECSTISSFKVNLKKHLLSQYQPEV